MVKKRKGAGVRFRGSFAVEASWVMAIVLFSLAAVIREAGRLHDETKGAMLIHEAVEKGRHERFAEPEELARFLEERTGLLLRFPSWRLELKRDGERFSGTGTGGEFRRQIEAERFCPERFMRRVTLIEDLGESDED